MLAWDHIGTCEQSDVYLLLRASYNACTEIHSTRLYASLPVFCTLTELRFKWGNPVGRVI